jgi:hypothetical protein
LLDTLADNGHLDEALEEKAEAVRIWEEIVELADSINWPPGRDGAYVKLSSIYGLMLFRVVHAGWKVMIEGLRQESFGIEDPAVLTDAISYYDSAWEAYRKLSASPQCPSLYHGEYFSLPGSPATAGLDASVDLYRTPSHS